MIQIFNSGFNRLIFRLLIIACCAVYYFNGFAQNFQQQKPLYADTIDVLNYEIHIDISNIPSRTIAGNTIIKLKLKSNNIHYVHFSLLALTIDSIFADNIKINQFAYNDTIVSVRLPNAISVNDTILVNIYYHGTPKKDPSGWGGFYFSTDNNFAYNLGVGMNSNPHCFGRVWFPCIDEFDERATYDIYARVLSNKMAICGGSLVSTIDNADGTKTYRWKLNDSIPTYLASIAVGPYVCVKDSFNGLIGNIPIDLYVRSSDTIRTRQSFIHLKNAIQIFEECFGPYYWQRVGYVGIPFNSGAMEHATNIAYPFYAIDGSLSNETLMTHEFSHNWFGNLITCKTENDMWINEGWASYCEPLFIEKFYGINQAKNYIRTTHKNVITKAHIDDGGYYPVGNVPHNITYGTTVYKKGSGVVHTLRHYLGDSLFFASVTQLLANNKFKSINTIELRDKLSAISGVNLHDFFNAWILSPGFPMFLVDSFRIINNTLPEKEVMVYVREKLRKTNTYAMQNKAEVTFMGANWQLYTKKISFAAPVDSVTVVVPFEPVVVMMDFNEKMCDATTDYYMTIYSTGTKTFSETNFSMVVDQIVDSAFVRVEQCWTKPDPLKTPLPGLCLADNRYWKIDGIFPTDFIAKGRFYYAKTQNIDSIIHTNSIDSVKMMYRRHSGEDWQFIPFTRIGNAYTGNLIVDSLRKGEYTMAIWNHAIWMEENKLVIKKNAEIKVFPNPATDVLHILLQANGKVDISVFNNLGKRVINERKTSISNLLTMDISSLPVGVYYLQVVCDNPNIRKSVKFVIARN